MNRRRAEGVSWIAHPRGFELPLVLQELPKEVPFGFLGRILSGAGGAGCGCRPTESPGPDRSRCSKERTPSPRPSSQRVGRVEPPERRISNWRQRVRRSSPGG